MDKEPHKQDSQQSMLFDSHNPRNTPSAAGRRPSFAESMSTLLAAVREGSTGLSFERGAAKDRSSSRDNEFHSTGRGGAGNIRPSSTSRDARPREGPDDFSSTRGREMAVSPKVTHYASGGAGNIRSPSQDSTRKIQAERDVVNAAAAAAAVADHDLLHSSGRGGLGNIARSRSPPAPDVRGRPLHSSGRGGAGNIGPFDAAAAQEKEDEERRGHRLASPGIHSTGRGGLANLTDLPVPPIDRDASPHDPPLVHSAGRGGVGNIREASRPRTSMDAASATHKE